MASVEMMGARLAAWIMASDPSASCVLLMRADELAFTRLMVEHFGEVLEHSGELGEVSPMYERVRGLVDDVLRMGGFDPELGQ